MNTEIAVGVREKSARPVPTARTPLGCCDRVPVHTAIGTSGQRHERTCQLPVTARGSRLESGGFADAELDRRIPGERSTGPVAEAIDEP